MKKRLTSFILILSFQAQGASLQPSIHSCQAYSALSRQLNCDKSSYINRFGKRYCQIYLNQSHRGVYSPSTVHTLNGIRYCLQDMLLEEPDLTCANAQDKALRHHIQCYRQSNFCSLSLYEKVKIFYVVQNEIFDSRFRQVIGLINNFCRQAH